MHTDAWHSILYAYITFKFTKSELFILKMSLPLLLKFLENGPYDLDMILNKNSLAVRSLYIYIKN